MARFYFDLHHAGDAHWDDDGWDCSEPAEVEARARWLLVTLAVPSGAEGPAASVYVLDADHIVVLIATSTQAGIRVQWLKLSED